LFVVDDAFHLVWKIPDGANTPVAFAGRPLSFDTYDPSEPIGDGGPATAATVFFPLDVSVHPLYNDVYISHEPFYADSRVRKVDALTGVISTFVGSGEQDTASGDGGPPSEAYLRWAYGIGVRSDGALFVAEDTTAAAGVVRMVSCG
jgi:hypothetical protein